MRPLLAALACLVLLASGADAQQRRPAAGNDAEKPPECGALPKDWSGEAYAVDGATLGGTGLKPPLRLWGVQAPELRDRQTGLETSQGMRARAALEDLLERGDRKVKCRIARWDRECRAIAQCLVETSPNALDAGGYMLASGLAYGFHLEDPLAWEPKAGQRYAGAEAEARRAQRGLWPQWLGDK